MNEILSLQTLREGAEQWGSLRLQANENGVSWIDERKPSQMVKRRSLSNLNVKSGGARQNTAVISHRGLPGY